MEIKNQTTPITEVNWIGIKGNTAVNRVNPIRTLFATF